MNKNFLNYAIKTVSACLLLFLLFLPMAGSAAELSIESKSENEPMNHIVFLPQITRAFPWSGNPFGFESERSISNASLTQKAIELHPGWARLNGRISWRDLQPQENGPIQWNLLADFEKELGILKAQHIQPIIVVDDYPRWATIVPNSCSPLLESKFGAFASFMEALVDRYSTPGFNVYNWELGNEVDVDRRLVETDSHYGCWGNIDDLTFYGGDYYGKMVKVVGAAIKQRNPAATVWLGGLMIATPLTTNPDLGKPENFLRGILAVGAAPSFDYVSYHGHQSWYGSRIDPVVEYAGGAWAPYQGDKSRFIRQILQEYGVTKRLFLTEAGVGCPEWNAKCVAPPLEFFQFQADQGIRSIVRVVNSGNDGFVWYQMPGPSWRYSSLLNGSYEPQPIYTAYKQLISQTWMSEPVGQVSYGTGLDAYEFRKGNTRIDVVWTNQDVTIPINIPANEFIKAYDRNGAVITPFPSGFNFVLTASFSPIYVIRGPAFQSVSAVWPNAQEVGAQEVALFRKDFFSQTQP